jgi:gluconolactonase
MDRSTTTFARAVALMLCASGAAAWAQVPATTPAIAGVTAAGTAIEIVKEGFDGTEGPLPRPDGGILFTENRAGRIVRIAADGATSVWHPASGANALAYNPKGQIVAALTASPAIGIGVVDAGVEPRLLVKDHSGRPFGRPNDLIVGKHGQVYFTDPGVAAAAGEPPTPTAVYQLASDGRLTLIASDVARPNGVALSPDERRLYLADTPGEWIIAFDLDEQGAVKGRRNFAKLATQPSDTGPRGGADGLAVDEDGRLYVASSLGVQVFSPDGKALGIIALPKSPQNLAFAGKDRSVLYVVGRGSVYRLATLTHGPHRAGK